MAALPMAAPCLQLSLIKHPSRRFGPSSAFLQGLQPFHVSRQPFPTWYLWQKGRDFHTCALDSNSEKTFQSTVELDKFIDELKEADHRRLPELVAKNVLSFDTTFWMRLATRVDVSKSSDDKKDYEELATSIMTVVERVVQKTEEKIDSSTDLLKSILKPVTSSDEEILWPPRDPRHLVSMKEVLKKHDEQGYLDESFLSSVSAQMRQAKEDGDKPGLVAMLQKVLQMYAASMLSKTSYAVKDGKVDKAEEFLEKLMADNEENWAPLLRTGFVVGGVIIEPEDLNKAIKKRIERVTMRTESGSYKQRIIVEYLKEIEERAQAEFEAFQASKT